MGLMPPPHDVAHHSLMAFPKELTSTPFAITFKPTRVDGTTVEDCIQLRVEAVGGRTWADAMTSMVLPRAPAFKLKCTLLARADQPAPPEALPPGVPAEFYDKALLGTPAGQLQLTRLFREQFKLLVPRVVGVVNISADLFGVLRTMCEAALAHAEAQVANAVVSLETKKKNQ